MSVIPELVRDVLVPSLSILIPTGVAIWLARRERQDARASLRRERVLAAASPIFEDLATIMHLDVQEHDWRPHLSRLRAHTATFRAALDHDDTLMSDWLALRHREGMSLLEATLQMLPGTPFGRYDATAMPAIQAWANVTMQQMQGWMSGSVPPEWFAQDGGRIIAKYGTGNPSGDVGTQAPESA